MSGVAPTAEIGLPTRASGAALHILCERDVGLFSLVQQVIANVPWALAEGRVPVARFGRGCSYWHPEGHRGAPGAAGHAPGANSVWEYYFEPIVADWPAARIPDAVHEALDTPRPGEQECGRSVAASHFATCHFGDHPELTGRTLSIPYLWDDPGPALRSRCAGVIRDYVRPRAYIEDAVAAFRRAHLPGSFIGLHLRGTDAISRYEVRAHRKGSLSFRQYIKAVRRALSTRPETRLFVATDSECSLERMRDVFGDRVVAFPSLRHRAGEAAGRGPSGAIMPRYVSRDSHAATRNGEEAVIEYRLLCESSLLIHNGSGLARTVLLARPDLPHVNTHLARRYWVFAVRNAQRIVQRLRRRGVVPQ